MSSLQEIFKSPFELAREETDDPGSWVLEYKTKEISGETTIDKLYDKCFIYSNYFMEKYRDYVLDGVRAKCSEYWLFIVMDSDDVLKDTPLPIAMVNINNNTDEIKKANNVIKKDVKVTNNFYLTIVVTIRFEDYMDEEYDEDFYGGFEKKENEKTISPKEYCIKCESSKQNILFLNCGHLILCEKCDENKKLKRCSKCKSLINQRILLS